MLASGRERKSRDRGRERVVLMRKGVSSFQAVPPSEWPLPKSIKHCSACASSNWLNTLTNCGFCGRVCCTKCLKERMLIPGSQWPEFLHVCSICCNSIAAYYRQCEEALLPQIELESQITALGRAYQEAKDEVRRVNAVNSQLLEEQAELKNTIRRIATEERKDDKNSFSSKAQPQPNSDKGVSAAPSPIAVEEPACQDESIEKREFQLELQTKALRIAQLAVSAEATRIVQQRCSFENLEKRLMRDLSMQLCALYEVERDQLEECCLCMIRDFQIKVSEFLNIASKPGLQTKALTECGEDTTEVSGSTVQ